MRNVGRDFRGRPLATPRTNAIRPTTDRTREAVFNVLAHRFADKLDGARVLDLFAGTGALGIEAISRGANVWMAPGARPQGRKKDEALPARSPRPRGEGKGEGRDFATQKAAGAPRKRREDGPGDRPPSPRKPGPGNGPRKGRGDADRRR